MSRRRQQSSGFLSRARAVIVTTCACVGIVQAGNRIVFDSQRPLVTTRLDPIIFPGTISQHVHRVIGANNFHANYDPVQLRQSTCSTMAPQADLSNYWHPSIYKVVVQPDGSTKYAPMWGQTRIYYNFPTLKSGTGPGTYVEPFPDNFQMVAGSPSKKVGGRYLQEDLSIFYYCEQDYGNGTVVGYSTYDLPKFGCSFLTTKVWFPSCWNGQPFDITNTSAHVQYPLIGAGLTGPNCPVGYERRIPSILVETFYFGYGTNGWMQWYNTPYDQWGGNGNDTPTYILANGDTTGYGLHADFSNGWNTTVLSQVVKQCLNTDINLRADKACPPLAASWNQTKANNCQLSQNTQIADEAIGWDNYLDNLPGCNLPWPNGTKPICPGYKERRWSNWSRLVGVELNPEPSLADLANDPFGLNGTTTTGITSGTTAATTTTFDTNSTTLTVPTTSIVVPTTTSISDASPSLVTDSTTSTGNTDVGTSTTDVCLTRGTACDTTALTSGASSAASSTSLSETAGTTTALSSSTVTSDTTAASSATTTSDSSSPSTSDQSSGSSLGSTSQDGSGSSLSSTAVSSPGSTTSTDASSGTNGSSTSLGSPSTSGSSATTVKPPTTAGATTTTKVTSTTTKKPSTSTTEKPSTTSTKKPTTTTTKKTSTTTKKTSTTTKKTSTTTKKTSPTTKKTSTTTSKANTTSKISTTSKTSPTLAPGRGAALSSKTTSTTSKPTSKTVTTSSKALLASGRGRGLSSSSTSEVETEEATSSVPQTSTEEVTSEESTISMTSDAEDTGTDDLQPTLALFRGRKPATNASLKERNIPTSSTSLFTLALYREL